MSALLLLRAVPAAGLLAVLDALGVQRAAHDLVANARQVLHPAATAQHDGVFLQVVALAGNVGGDLDQARQLDAGDLAQRRVRLLRGGGVDARAHTAPLGAALEGGRLGLTDLVGAALADQLLDRGHALLTSSFATRPCCGQSEVTASATARWSRPAGSRAHDSDPAGPGRSIRLPVGSGSSKSPGGSVRAERPSRPWRAGRAPVRLPVRRAAVDAAP